MPLGIPGLPTLPGGQTLDPSPVVGSVDDAAVKDEKVRLSVLIREETGWRGHAALVARGVTGGESGFNPEADNGICCIGLMQVNLIHKGKFGIPADEKAARAWLKNARNNLRASYKIFLAQGWNAWEAFTNGAYKLHMGKDPLITVKKNSATGAVGDAVGGAVDAALGPIDEIGAALLSADTWFRVGKGALGYSIVVIGLAGITLIVAMRVGKTPIGKAVKSKIPVPLP